MHAALWGYILRKRLKAQLEMFIFGRVYVISVECRTLSVFDINIWTTRHYVSFVEEKRKYQFWVRVNTVDQRNCL